MLGPLDDSVQKRLTVHGNATPAARRSRLRSRASPAGASTTEYAIVAALVVAIVLGIAGILSTGMRSAAGRVAGCIVSFVDGTGSCGSPTAPAPGAGGAASPGGVSGAAPGGFSGGSASIPPATATALINPGGVVGFLTGKPAPGSGANGQPCDPNGPPPNDRDQAIDRSNMVREQAEVFSRMARQYGKVIMVRPFNRAAAEWIKRGAATKPLKIKGKTADQGSVAGLVPFDQRKSKLGTRLDELEKIEDPTPDERAEMDRLRKQIRDLNAANQEAVDKGLAQVIIINGEQVLATPGGQPRPYTADYDLLAVGENFLNSPVELDDEIGWVTPEERQLIDDINRGVAETGYQGGRVVQNGAENRFPSSEGYDFPITAYEPDGNVRTIENSAQLKDYVNENEKKPGWTVTPNERWGWQRGEDGRWNC